MSVVNITDVNVLQNPSLFLDPFQFEITFECIAPLKEELNLYKNGFDSREYVEFVANSQDLEFKVIYVGSAESESYDQVLDSILVGPVPVGVNKFVFQADPPDPARIPQEDIIGVTYMNREFVRIGYYVNNEYAEEELKENPPSEVQFGKLTRNILAEKPRVTRFPIEWDGPEQGMQIDQDQPQGGMIGAAEGDIMAQAMGKGGVTTEGFGQSGMVM